MVESSLQPNLLQSDLFDLKERIYRQIRPDLERIELEIERHLSSSVPLISVVARHIMGSGGKRLRPLLMVLCSRLCGYRDAHDVTLSVVFEFVHAASLLHDDVVDHAEVRRNQPAANTIWGNPAVVLVGDYLYSKSILMTVGYGNMRILEVLSNATTRMSEGEVLQLIHADNLEIDEQEYMEVITRKTAVLISAACQIGAIFGGADSVREEALRRYGHDLGIAFQLTDDALDFMGDVKELGKPVGNDVKEGKVTLPIIHALRHASPKEKQRIKEIFSSDEIRPEDFQEVKQLVVRSGGIEYTLRHALARIQGAKDALQMFPEHPTRQVLTDMADYVLCRRT